MEALITYSIKVSIAIAVFYLLHIIFLKNETFFKIRRGYFLFALAFSLIFPFIDLSAFGIQLGFAEIVGFNLNEIVITANDTTNHTTTSGASSVLNILYLLPLIASLGTIFILGRFLIQFLSLSSFLNKNQLFRKDESLKIIEVEDDKTSPFSFFNWIVINKKGKTESEIEDIMTHEKAHVSQLHSIDVLLYELFCSFFWWNPFAWLMKNEMKLNLEYLADEQVLNSKVDLKDYQYTLLQISIANTGMAFINNFNVSHLKKRIIMMNKKRSPILAMAKYLLMLPLAFFLIQCNSNEQGNKETGNISADALEKVPTNANIINQEDIDSLPKNIFEVVEQMPRFPGGEQAMMKYIMDNLKYPEDAQKAGIQGRVVVRFIVSETGEIIGEKILRGIDPSCDKEALRVVEAMPKWQPGKQKGKEVPVYFTLPILFKLQ